MDINPVSGLGNIIKNTPLTNVVDNSLKLDKNPFQSLLDKAVDSLNAVSAQEMNSEKLINDYIQGKASLEDVMIEVEKANLSVNLAMTVINTSVTTIKEIMQMPV